MYNTMAYKGESAMPINKYRTAGWMAIISVFIVIPAAACNILIGARPDIYYWLLPSFFVMGLLEWSLASYALYQFKNFLNEHYKFHEVDIFIIILIISSLVAYAIAFTTLLAAGDSMPTRHMPIHPAKIGGIIAMGANGLIMGIVGIIFGIKLFKLDAKLHGYLQPMTYLLIAGSACFALFFLAPVGSLLYAIFTILLGVVLINGPDPEEIPEFV